MTVFFIGCFLFAGYGILIFLYKKWWRQLDCFTPANQDLTEGNRPFISVLIPARNEAKNIVALLLSIAHQSYCKDFFEVILIDDHSTDETIARAEEVRLPNLRIHVLRDQTENSSKKKAIAAGVEQARGELIICTDADCIVPPNWLSVFAAFYLEKKAAFIAAPVLYSYEKNLLQLLQTVDFLTLQGITAASVQAHFHSMCNGANLAYSKKAFEAVNGFEGIDQVASGDDMLLMYKIWQRQPEKVFYLKSKEVIVRTQPMLTWKDFFWQRVRWASKTTHYQDKRVFWTLVLIYLFNLYFFFLLGLAFFHPVYWWGVGAYLLLKTAIEFPFVSSVAGFYNEKKLMRYFFWLQPLHIFYTVSIGALSQWGSYYWKGRKTK